MRYGISTFTLQYKTVCKNPLISSVGNAITSNTIRCVFWVVRSFVLCDLGSSLLWTPALRPYSGPVHLFRERKGIGRCVRCVLATRGEGGLSRSEQLVGFGYLYSAPFLDVAYCLA